MPTSTRKASILAGLLTTLVAREALAESWAVWADSSNGVLPRTFPALAISPQRDIFFTYLAPQPDHNGVVYRAHLDDPGRTFTAMPSFPLPTPAPGKPYDNVFTMTTTAQGEPVVGLSANGLSNNTEPMLMTWDKTAGHWLAPTITPASAVCAHNLFTLDRAPNGDLWAGCQWHGAYHSTDDGRTFQYVDVSALVAVSTPGYFPTRSNGASSLGALYGLTLGPDGSIYVGTESGGVVYSSDRGASFHPLDRNANDPMSPMARATNMGNVAGLGVTPDGRVLAQGVPGLAPYPQGDTSRLYVFDTVARTTTVGVGFPAYFLGGQTVAQIVTLPSGRMFLHTGHDTVDPTTGTPTLGGIMASTDGVSWAPENTGIDEVFKISGNNGWVDGNGKGTRRPFAIADNTLYTVTKTGKIYALGAVGGADAGTSSGGSTGASSGGTTGGSTGASPGGTTGGSTGASPGGSPTGGKAGGCAVGGGPSRDAAGMAVAALLALGVGAVRRRRRGGEARQRARS